MTVLPEPRSTYHLLRRAADTWPDAVATPDAARYTDAVTST